MSQVWMRAAAGIDDPYLYAGTASLGVTDSHDAMPPCFAIGTSLRDWQTINRASGRRRLGQHDPKARVRDRFNKRQEVSRRYGKSCAPLIVRLNGRRSDLPTRITNVKQNVDRAERLTVACYYHLVSRPACSRGRCGKRKRWAQFDRHSVVQMPLYRGFEDRVRRQLRVNSCDVRGVSVQQNNPSGEFILRVAIFHYSDV